MLTTEQAERELAKALERNPGPWGDSAVLWLKKYFDERCGCCVYELLPKVMENLDRFGLASEIKRTPAKNLCDPLPGFFVQNECAGERKAHTVSMENQDMA